MSPPVYVLYENEAWLPPLLRALEARGLRTELMFVEGGAIRLDEPPPEGIFVNRMSPSAHTRDHGDGVHFMREYLYFLEANGRRVINGSKAFALEVSKVRQDAALRAAGFRTPTTVAVAGIKALLDAGLQFRTPFMTKHNMGGKGLGVRLFRDHAAFADYVSGPDFETAFDGVTVLQQYIEPPDRTITRVELVDGELVYAIRASTAQGFELCPAVECAVEPVGDAFCPVGESAAGRFTLREDLGSDDPIVGRYAAFMRRHRLDVAGIEFVEDAAGERYTYDINANTNYNSDVERTHGLDGMGAIADLCARCLAAG